MYKNIKAIFIKCIFIILFAVSLIVVLLLLFRPTPLDSPLKDTDEWVIGYQTFTITDGTPDIQNYSYQLKGQPDKLKEIRRVLQKYTYYRCRRTGSDNCLVESNSMKYLLLLSDGDNIIVLHDGTTEIIVNDHIYKILKKEYINYIVSEIKYILDNERLH